MAVVLEVLAVLAVQKRSRPGRYRAKGWEATRSQANPPLQAAAVQQPKTD